MERPILYMPIVVLPLFVGGARSWVWGAVAAIFSSLLAVVLFTSKKALFPPGIGKTLAVLAPVLLYPFLQAIPLPMPLLALFTPQRADWLKRAQDATGTLYSAASLSYVPVDTCFSGLWFVVLALFGLMLHKSLRSDSAEVASLFQLLFAVAGFEALLGLLQVLMPSIEATTRFASGTFVNRNHYASFLGMIWPLQLCWLLTISQKGKRTDAKIAESASGQANKEKQFFFCFLTALTLLGLIFSASRGGIISALIGTTVLAYFGDKRFKKAIPFLAICWVIVFGYFCIMGFEAIIDRFWKLGESAPERLRIWRFTLNMIQDHWLTGTGLATYGPVVFLYQVFDSDLVQVGNAHCDYLQITAECGIVFGLLVSTLAWGYWWTAATDLLNRKYNSNQREPGTGDARLIRTGALAGSAAFLCHAWVEFGWQIPANQVCFVLLLALMRYRPTTTRTIA